MRKNRRGIREDGAHDLELSDVNEQELAKSVEGHAAEHVREEGMDKTLRGEEKQNAREAADERNDVSAKVQFVTAEVSGGEIVARSEEPTELVSTAQEPAEPENEEKSETLEGDREPPEDTSDDGSSDEEDGYGMHRAGRIYVAVIAACMIVALLIFGFAVMYGAVKSDGEPQTEETGESEVQTDKNEVQSDSVSPQSLASLCQSAVSVVTEREGRLGYASGTAVLEGGYVATLYSAVKDASSIKIVLEDGSAYPAEVVAYDESVELALLSTDAKQLRSVESAGAEYRVGETVYAVGNADGGALAASFFAGRVSYTSRSYEFNAEGGVRIANTVQISGFDNESMLGCPIFNQNGEAIAIAFAALEGKNTCFALPIDGVLSAMKIMRDGGELDRETLEVLAYSPATVSVWGKQSCIDGIWGVEIMDFEDGDGDSAVKLRRGDLIYRINDTFVAGTDALRTQLAELRSTDVAQIYVLRNGQRLSFDVILG